MHSLQRSNRCGRRKIKFIAYSIISWMLIELCFINRSNRGCHIFQSCLVPFAYRVASPLCPQSVKNACARHHRRCLRHQLWCCFRQQPIFYFSLTRAVFRSALLFNCLRFNIRFYHFLFPHLIICTNCGSLYIFISNNFLCVIFVNWTFATCWSGVIHNISGPGVIKWNDNIITRNLLT